MHTFVMIDGELAEMHVCKMRKQLGECWRMVKEGWVKSWGMLGYGWNMLVNELKLTNRVGLTLLK